MAQNFWLASFAFIACFVADRWSSRWPPRRTKTDEELKGLVYSLTPKIKDDEDGVVSAPGGPGHRPADRLRHPQHHLLVNPTTNTIMGLDIRWPIGLMFSLVGVLLAIYGFVTGCDAEMYQRSLDININLIWGVVLLVFGLAMLDSLADRPQEKRRQISSDSCRRAKACGKERRLMSSGERKAGLMHLMPLGPGMVNSSSRTTVWCLLTTARNSLFG